MWRCGDMPRCYSLLFYGVDGASGPLFMGPHLQYLVVIMRLVLAL